jgi:phage/plasmid primase-like uncharacterized protein
MNGQRLDIATINRLLRDRLEELATTLKGEPSHRLAHEWRWGRKGSFSLRLTGEKRGRWYDFEAGKGGDPLALIQSSEILDVRGALGWAKVWLGLDRGTIKSGHSVPAQRTHAPSSKTEEDRKCAYALRLWEEAKPVFGSVAESYLRNRGITLPVPPTLRFEPCASIRENDRDYTFPAMIVAAARWGERTPCAVQRTFLQSNGSGKADLATGARRTYGVPRGAAARLSAFSEGAELILAEGLETALSILQAVPSASVWACLGASGLRSVIVPDGAPITIAADADDAGAQATEFLAQRLYRDGHRVRIATPPNPGADFNDLLREASHV